MDEFNQEMTIKTKRFFLTEELKERKYPFIIEAKELIYDQGVLKKIPYIIHVYLPKKNGITKEVCIVERFNGKYIFSFNLKLRKKVQRIIRNCLEY